MIIRPLLKGLRLTLSRFFSRPITIQYPEQKQRTGPQVERHPLFPEGRERRYDLRCLRPLRCRLSLAVHIA